MNLQIGDMVRESHHDLTRKYARHATAVEAAWRSMDKAQRIQCIRVGAADGVVLKTATDRSMGNVYKILPEWNLHDIAESGPNYLLDMLKHRATTTLFDQYRAGPGGDPQSGDRGVIEESMAKRNLQHTDPFKDCWTFFLNSDDDPRKTSDMYGKSYHVVKDNKGHLAAFGPAIKAGLCIPQSIGELILMRQSNVLSCLNIMIDDILDVGSTTRDRKQRPKRPQGKSSATDAATSLGQLSLTGPPAQPVTMADCVGIAEERRDAHQDFLSLVATEPVVLAYVVNIFFFTRPDLVPDEKGRHLPAITDRYISTAFFDTLHAAVRGASIWTYMTHLLKKLETTTTKDKPSRNVLLQELSNICSLEFERCKDLFKRQVQTRPGNKHFKRISNAVDKNGDPKVALKSRPEQNRMDTQLYWILRLWEPETDHVKAREYLENLSGFHQSYPEERESLAERETEALFDLAVIVAFIQDLSSVVKLPSPSRKKGQAFVARLGSTHDELNKLKGDIDLRNFAAPIDHLLEPGMAEAALSALDVFLQERAGASMGGIYRDLVEDSLTDVVEEMEQEKVKTSEGKPQLKRLLSPEFSAPQSTETVVQERRVKQKTRPSNSPAFALTSQTEQEESIENQPIADKAAHQQTFTVSPATHDAFTTLFVRTKESRGFVNWTAFESAMAELGFSVFPKFGSVYTFQPPASIGARRSLTVHRPHQSRIEGRLVLIFARRLSRTYGWTEETFKVST